MVKDRLFLQGKAWFRLEPPKTLHRNHSDDGY